MAISKAGIAALRRCHSGNSSPRISRATCCAHTRLPYRMAAHLVLPRPAELLNHSTRRGLSAAALPSAVHGRRASATSQELSSTVCRAAQAPIIEAGPPSVRVEAFEGLEPDDFRHPLDQQNTRLLQLLPGLQVFARNLMGPVAEQVLLLENIGTSLHVGPNQLPSLHKLLVQASATLQMATPPDLYVRQHPSPNAYTLAISGRKPFVVVHTALLELLEPMEVQAVIAHELGHLKCDHGVWLTIANVLASGTLSVLPAASRAVEEALLRWLRAAELTCDRAALLVVQDPRVVVSTLMKLAGGSPSLSKELNVDAFLEQARSYEEATSSILGWYLRNAQTRALSHPLPVMRAKEIDQWARSSQYRALVNKNRIRRGLPVTSSAISSD